MKLNPANPTLSEAEAKQLETNIQVVRDTLVFFTAIAGIKGFAGHTGGAFDIVPEVLIADGFMKHSPSVYPAYFDEAGHRVAIQYAMAAFNGEMPFEKLYQYRAANEKLYGHPEIEEHLGIKFASGRLGHMWPFVNGVALANLFALPAGKKLKRFCHHKKVEREIAAVGVLGIANSVSPKVLVERMKGLAH